MAVLAAAGSVASLSARSSNSSTRPIPLAATMPNSERWPRSALTLIVRCLTSSSRVLCNISVACCSALLIGTKRIPGRDIASQCVGVDHVVLAALDIGLGVSRRHQQHFVSHGLELTRPIMRRTAGLHTDEAGLNLRKEFVHFRAPQLPRHGGADFANKRVDLKIILGQIDADSDKLLHGRSPSLWRSCDHALAL